MSEAKLTSLVHPTAPEPRWPSMPCLGVHREGGYVILFTQHTHKSLPGRASGVIVSTPKGASSTRVGFYSDGFYLENFEPFYGKVTLSQDP